MQPGEVWSTEPRESNANANKRDQSQEGAGGVPWNSGQPQLQQAACHTPGTCRYIADFMSKSYTTYIHPPGRYYETSYTIY